MDKQKTNTKMKRMILMAAAAVMAAWFTGCKKEGEIPQPPIETGEAALFNK
jgi:hypothetical protein